MNARLVHGWALLASAPTLALTLACSASASRDGGDARAPAQDAGTFLPDDASGPDAGSTGFDGGIGAPPEADPSDGPAFASACLDGRDQNGVGGLDCADVSCAHAPSCCIGSSDPACCTHPGLSVTLSFACGAGPCDDLARFTAFGNVGPIPARDGTYVPVSDDGADSGAFLDDAIDPRASVVTLGASIAVPNGSVGIDAIGIGLFEGPASAHVVPVAALVVSASRGEILLLLGDSIAGAAPAPTDGIAHDYTLTVGPTGTVTATGGGASLSTQVTLPTGSTHAGFFGRATNPGAGELPARIGSFSVGVSACDQPTALERVGAITIIDETNSAMLDTASEPSIATDGTTTALAFTATSMLDPTHPGIFVATRQTDGTFHVQAPGVGAQPLLAPAPGEQLSGPALGATADGRWILYAARVHADGSRSLVVATSSDASPLSLGSISDLVISGQTGDFSAPAIVPGHSDRLVARHVPGGAELTSRTPELVLLVVTPGAGTAAQAGGLCGADSSCADGVRSEQTVYAARATSVAFDADDVSDPAIVFYDHVYRLYYAGRLGSRWSIGMLVTVDLGYWRVANEGRPILAADGEGEDAVSVRAPAPFVEDGQLWLYYVGSDGDRSTLLRARGGVAPAP